MSRLLLTGLLLFLGLTSPLSQAANEPIDFNEAKQLIQKRINSSTPRTTEVNVNMPIAYDGDELMIAFKGDYLSDVIKAVTDPEIIMEFSSTSTPVVFKDPSDPDFLSVIMPMKV